MNTHDLVEAVRLACQLSAQRYSVESARDIRDLDLSAIEARYATPGTAGPDAQPTVTIAKCGPNTCRLANTTMECKTKGLCEHPVAQPTNPLADLFRQRGDAVYEQVCGADCYCARTTVEKLCGTDAQPTPSPAVSALLSYTQADEDGVFVLASRQAIHEVVGELYSKEAYLKLALAQKDADLALLRDELEHALRRDEVNDLKKANKILCDELESMNRSLEGEIEAREEAERERDLHYTRVASLIFSEFADLVTGNQARALQTEYVDQRKRAESAEQRLAAVEAQLAGVVEMCAKEVPHTWLDPLLTGSNAVIEGPPYTVADIENLMRAIKKRIRALSPVAGYWSDDKTYEEAPKAEPVAWRFCVQGMWFVAEKKETCLRKLMEAEFPYGSVEIEPLYAAPQDAQAERLNLARLLWCYDNTMAALVQPCMLFEQWLAAIDAARAGKQERTK